MKINFSESNFLTQAWRLERDERIAFNSDVNRFQVVKKGVKLAKNCTTDLRELAKQVDDYVTRLNGNVAKPADSIFLAANLKTLNERCRRLNATIDSSCWLSFIDKVLAFVTRGKVQLRCQHLLNLGNINNFLRNEVTKLLKKTELFEFESFALFAKKHLATTEYEKYFIQEPLENYATLTHDAKHNLGSFIEQNVQDKEALFNWKNLSADTRFALLEHHILGCYVNVKYPLEAIVFGQCLKEYATLTLNEKKLIKTLFDSPFYPHSFEGVSLMMKAMQDEKRAQKTEKQLAFTAYLLKTYSSAEKELDVLLQFINAFSFQDTEKTFARLSKAQIEKIIKLFSKATDKKLDHWNRIILPLCAALINIDYDLFLNDEDTQESVAELMQRCKVSGLTDEGFLALTNTFPLSTEFKKTPDRFLATATEEQLEKYYTPLEKHLTVNKQHIRATLVSEVVAPLPPGETVSYDEMLGMFDQINFKDKTKADYVDPALLRNAENAPISVAHVRKGLASLITDLKECRPKTGMPNSQTESEKFKKYYTNVQRFIQHIIVQLKRRPQADRSVYLITLGIMGLYCGIRYMVISQDLYCQLTGSTYNIESESLTGGLYKILAGRRAALANKAIHDIVRDSHYHMAFLKAVGPELKLSDAEVLDFDDPYENENVKAVVRSNKYAIINQVYKDYTPTMIINEIMKHLEGIGGHPKTIKREFYETVLDWFKENFPEEYQKKLKENPAYNILEDVYEMNTGRIKREWVVHLLKEINALDKPGGGIFGLFKRFEIGSLFCKIAGWFQGS